MPHGFDWREAFALVTRKGEPALRDSKKLSAQQRDTLHEYIVTHGRLKHAHAFTSAEAIDVIGIVNAANEAAAAALRLLEVSIERAEVLLDAGLRVPGEWKQQSFIRGDENVPAIALASVIAKVERDRFMTNHAAEEYPGYGLEEHKGYGTLAHRRAIQREGLSGIHRASFCRALRSSVKSV